HEKAKKAMIYSHTKHINAFSAMLEPEEAKEISKQDTILSVFKCQGLQMHTIKAWRTLGLEKEDGLVPSDSLWNKTNFGQDIIIANMDSGVDPSSRSFQDDGMGPIPSKWKGHCDEGSSCNRKLISRRMFVEAFIKTFGEDYRYSNLTDLVGHGTHTLSTAGGRFVPGINLKGVNGTVKGGAPNARLASYKITLLSCDVLAALDEAIHDGVDVVSISMGEKDNLDGQYSAGVAIGTLHAVKKGIVTVMCAGNYGPQEGCVQNLPPWVITVGASQDRKITVNVELGNKQMIKGKSSIDKWPLQKKLYPLTRFIDISKPNTTKVDSPAE
ncbi:Subtilisin-like protease, partial [Thalictrum thalictroides]